MRVHLDGNGIAWHVDKDGKPIRYNQPLLGDDGKRYEIMGTGMWFPGDGDGQLFWNEENKLVRRSTQEMRCVMSEGAEVALAIAAAMAGLLMFAMLMNIVGAL